MLRFFRHIRKTLMEQNKTRTYMLYAIGEVFLVVIGILIALQVNNWNEQRKNVLEAEELLQINMDNLLSEIEAINRRESFYTGVDSTLHFLLYETPAPNFLGKPESIDYRYVMMGYSPYDVNLTDWERLAEMESQIPIEMKEVYRKMDALYESRAPTVNNIMGDIGTLVTEQYDEMRRFRWYKNYHIYDVRGDNFSGPEYLEYLTENIDYQNRLVTYHSILWGNFRVVLNFQHHAKLLYIEASDYLGSKTLPNAIELRPFQPPASDDFTGIYHNMDTATSFEILKDEEYLYLKRGSRRLMIYEGKEGILETGYYKFRYEDNGKRLINIHLSHESLMEKE